MNLEIDLGMSAETYYEGDLIGGLYGILIGGIFGHVREVAT